MHQNIEAATDKAALIEQVLMRAAEQIGDVTPLAMAAFYRLHSDAPALYDALSRGERRQLEGRMIENSLYCLMRWFEAPFEISVMFTESVPHHQRTLNVPATWYGDLIEVTADVVAQTIPTENTAEIAAWAEACSDLRMAIEESSE